MSETTTPRNTTAATHRPRDQWYWRLRRWMTPGLRNAQYAYFDTLDTTLQAGDRWLDLGCGRRLAPLWLRHRTAVERVLLARAGEAVGIDPDAGALADNALPIRKHLAVAERVPEPGGSFDLITANMVVEHLDNPGAVLAEAARLLRPGGRMLIHTPNRWYPLTAAAACVPYPLRRRIAAALEKRPAQDIYPTRYRLNTAGAFARHAARAGLVVEQLTRTTDSPETLRLGPGVAPELALIALTRLRPLHGMQSNLIVTLRKPGAAETVAGGMHLRCRSSAESSAIAYGDAA